MLPVIAGVEGLVLTPRERELFSRLQPAGYILFTRNIADYELTRELTDELRRLTTGPDEPIIAIDQEGGRVVRTAEIGVQLPSAAALAQKGCSHHIRQAAYYNAACLHTLGVNTNFAPVLDLASPHANALPSRCWGYDSRALFLTPGCGIMPPSAAEFRPAASISPAWGRRNATRTTICPCCTVRAIRSWPRHPCLLQRSCPSCPRS